MTKIVIAFDLDGTLIDSTPLKTKNFVQVCTKFLNIPSSEISRLTAFYSTNNETRTRQFLTIANLYQKSIDQTTLNTMSKTFDHLFFTQIDHIKLFPKVKDILYDLTQKGFSFGISSAVPHQPLQNIVNRLFTNNLNSFHFILGYRHEKWKKPHHHVLQQQFPNARFVLVGDKVTDYHLAKNNNMEFIGFRLNQPEIELKIDDWTNFWNVLATLL